MSIKYRIRDLVRSAGLSIGKISRRNDLLETIKLLKPVATGMELIRIGGEDGGYLVPDDFEGITHCFSPGVSDKADFEEQIAREYGIGSFMADASVDGPPYENPLFDFEKKFLGARDEGVFMRLSTWMDRKLDPTADDDLVLQMDIEGAEFEVLIDSTLETLRKFRIMVIEFHAMDRLFNRDTLPMVRAVLQKLSEDFVVAHVHPNNCCGLAALGDIAVPRVFEVTFLRKDRLKPHSGDGKVVLPHRLDRRNTPSRKDIVLPEFWWR